MSKLTERIEELCPDGVEYRTIEELFDTRNGYTPSRSIPDFWVEEGIPWFRMDDIRTNGNILNDSLQHISPEAVKGGKLFPAGTVIVATSATIGEHALLKVPALSNQRFTALITKPEFSELLLPEFVHYYCFILDDWCVRNTTQSSFASVDMPKFRKFRFPVPPLEVQQEIVRVLDAFTDLEQSLVAELELRKKQYLYYRSEMMRTPFPRRPLSELVLGISSGRNNVRTDDGRYPVFGSTGQIASTDTPAHSGEAILIARVGANAGRVNFVSGEYDVSDNTLILRPGPELHPRYAYHLLSDMDLNQFAVGGGQPLITGKKLKALSVPVPPLAEQEQLAVTLDRFKALVDDMSSGIPAEIALRRKQYEFYRDELLSLPPKEI